MLRSPSLIAFLRTARHPGVLALLAVGLLLTILAERQVQAWIDRQAQADFVLEARQRAELVQQRLALYEEALRGLQGFFLQERVTRAEFREFVDLMRLQERLPGITDFRFARHVRSDELPAWRARVAQELRADYGLEVSFPPLDETRGEHLLIEMIHPWQGRERFYGFDLYASAARREALAAVRRSPAPALSQRAEEYAEPTYALIAAVPPRGEEAFPGTVALLFRPAALLADLSEIPDFDIELYDSPAATPDLAKDLIFDSGAAKALPLHGQQGFRFQLRQPLLLGGREWTLVVTALPSWGAARGEQWLAAAVAFGGGVATIFLAGLLGWLTNRRHQAERALSAQETAYRRLVESLPLVTYERDCDGRFRYLSPQAEGLLGRPAEHWLAEPQRFAAQMDDSDRQALAAKLREACEKSAAFELEYRFRTPQGTLRWVLDRGRAWRDDSGAMLVHGSLLDIERLKASEEALHELNAKLEARVAERITDLAAANARLEELAQAKQDFLATMSHEIRTPLTGLMGMLELLSLTPLDEEQRHEIAVAIEAGRTLGRIIDDILDFSKIEAGRLQFSLQPESLRRLVDGVRDAYLPLASSKGLSLLTTVDPRLPEFVVMDAMRVAQILNNYVSNAIKFTNRGYVELRAEWHGEDETGVDIDFVVRDTGVGLEPEVVERLFERYTQADAQVARRHGGTGLGLAICKRLAELMGGSVGVDSAPGRGSSFHLRLRLPRAAPEETRTPREPRGASVVFEVGGRPLLVADDHPTNRMLIARQLAQLGLDAELAENGSQALAKWKTGDYAAVITDCHMPILDGFELVQAIRALEAESGRPRSVVIAWTAAALPDEIARCQAVGMDDVLLKPTDLETLRQKIKRWLPHRSADASPQAALPIEPQVLADLAASEDEQRQILTDFVRQSEEDLDRLERLLAAKDFPAAAQQAHRLKGAARMVGAMALATRALRAEEAAQAGDADMLAQRCRELRADVTAIAQGLGAAAPPTAPSDAEPVWDPAALAELAGDAPQLHRELLDSFFAAGEALRLEMRQAYEKSDPHALARLAHRCKSAAQTIGARRLAAVCAELETAGNDGDWRTAAAAWSRMETAWRQLEERLASSSEIRADETSRR